MVLLALNAPQVGLICSKPQVEMNNMLHGIVHVDDGLCNVTHSLVLKSFKLI